MDRLIVFPGAIPLDTDVLSVERNIMTAFGWLAQAALGTTTGVVGLPCTPTAPASMTVNIGPGALWAQEVIDQNSFGSLPPDISPLMKMGILTNGAGTNFTLTAPPVSGQSINYLIEAAFEETDTTPVVLPYVNPTNPSQPYSGPANSGTPQNTVRTQTVDLQLKAGAAANTGTQTTPPVDEGYVGLYVITVNDGQTTITSANITPYPGAPFIVDATEAWVEQNFAALNGNSADVFNVANATQANHALPLGQAESAFAPLAGNANQTFEVAPGSGSQALQANQAFEQISFATTTTINPTANVTNIKNNVGTTSGQILTLGSSQFQGQQVILESEASNAFNVVTAGAFIFPDNSVFKGISPTTPWIFGSLGNYAGATLTGDGTGNWFVVPIDHPLVQPATSPTGVPQLQQVQSAISSAVNGLASETWIGEQNYATQNWSAEQFAPLAGNANQTFEVAPGSGSQALQASQAFEQISFATTTTINPTANVTNIKNNVGTTSGQILTLGASQFQGQQVILQSNQVWYFQEFNVVTPNGFIFSDNSVITGTSPTTPWVFGAGGNYESATLTGDGAGNWFVILNSKPLVQPATSPTGVPQLQQVQSVIESSISGLASEAWANAQFAPIAGNANQTFNVAPGSGTQALQASQAFEQISFVATTTINPTANVTNIKNNVGTTSGQILTLGASEFQGQQVILESWWSSSIEVNPESVLIFPDNSAISGKTWIFGSLGNYAGATLTGDGTGTWFVVPIDHPLVQPATSPTGVPQWGQVQNWVSQNYVGIPNTQVFIFKESTSWTPPANAVKIDVCAYGCGGPGSVEGAGCGGGGGGYGEALNLDATAMSSIQITITSTTATLTNGEVTSNSVGVSSFGTYLTVGGGGYGDVTGYGLVVGGSGGGSDGGSGGTAQITAAGQNGYGGGNGGALNHGGGGGGAGAGAESESGNAGGSGGGGGGGGNGGAGGAGGAAQGGGGTGGAGGSGAAYPNAIAPFPGGAGGTGGESGVGAQGLPGGNGAFPGGGGGGGGGGGVTTGASQSTPGAGGTGGGGCVVVIVTYAANIVAVPAPNSEPASTATSSSGS